jgi:AcrR family transcriptional regulator
MPQEPPSPARPGRPRSEAATSHARIMDAVHALLQETSVRDLTMEAVAKRAGVGKPTLYKWWPTKAALVMAMFHERLVGKLESAPTATAAEVIRTKVRFLIREFNGLFGKVTGDLIAEGQSDPAVLHEMHERHIAQRRAATIADVERGLRDGEFVPGTNPELLVDAIFGPIYYRLLLRFPLTQQYGDALVDFVLAGVKAPLGSRPGVVRVRPRRAT